MKTEKEIYEYLWKKLAKYEPRVDVDAQSEFDWCLTEISRELSHES